MGGRARDRVNCQLGGGWNSKLVLSPLFVEGRGSVRVELKIAAALGSQKVWVEFQWMPFGHQDWDFW